MHKMNGFICGAEIESENNKHLRKIFVGGLSINSTGETLHKFFSQFGVVSEAIVLRDPISQRSRCFGFVTYLNEASVENVQRLRPHIVDGKAVDTKRVFRSQQFNKTLHHVTNIRTNKIFLGGLRECHDETKLREYFEQFGNIISVKVMLNKETGRIRGFGFLEFERIESAARALGKVKHLINCKLVEAKKMMNFGKRTSLPIGGAACAGYGPPQPTIVDNTIYYQSYDPYLAQHSLPPSAFLNGWASYVAPYLTEQSHVSQHPGLNGYHPLAEFVDDAPKYTRNKNSFVERSKNELNPSHTKEANKQETSIQPINGVKVQSKAIDAVEKGLHRL